ncbi:uncharacterized protein LOC127607107 isoform X3 [Hippocampus zosterae]|uniref:uncharacterized protein LOC127607107 isoform X3 n=1 Tax=Hippocampus zosterae TaxID=109293 RepID=UPI00223D853D|nr:uncharacterized protein LOC127607107 isoform X3 [Hippocampus zosterae]
MPGTGGRRTCVGATAGLLFPDDAMDPAIQQFAHHCRHRQQKHCGSTKRRDTVDNISVEEGHSDSDLSDSERHSVLPSGGVPPKLELRPEVIQTRNCPSPGIRPKEQRLTRAPRGRATSASLLTRKIFGKAAGIRVATVSNYSGRSQSFCQAPILSLCAATDTQHFTLRCVLPLH